jgi:hypothetical protein
MDLANRRLPFALLFALIFSIACCGLVTAQDGGGGDGGGGDGGGDNPPGTDDVLVLGAVPQAGIHVDANGVLRMKSIVDATGKLSKRRLAQMRAAAGDDILRPSELRKISLNRLEASILTAATTGRGVTDEMRYLAGLTRIQYLFFYPESNDIVIAGPAEGVGMNADGRMIGLQTGKGVLHLQDLVVALRAFPPAAEPTRLIGCSIDPTPEGLARMQQFLLSIQGRITPQDDVNIALGLKNSLGDQVVTVLGVSPRTRFAQVLVEADYRMKLIGIGLERPPVKIKTYIEKASPAMVARNAMQRWYFVPNYESVSVSDDRLAMELVGEGVKLVGEHEVIDRTGVRTQTQKSDRASQIFVRSFTQKYAELAEHVPVYGDLRNMIDMTIVAAFIQQNDFYGQADWKMSLFGNESTFPVEVYQAPTRVESAVNVVWKGNRLMTPIGGGVTIQPGKAFDSVSVGEDTDGHIASARADTAIDDLPADSWWWD